MVEIKKKDKKCFPYLFTESGRYSEESAICAMLLPNMPKFPLLELSCLIFFLLPMLCIAVLYVKMGLRIRSNGLDCSIEGSVHGETRQTQSRKAIIRMLSKFSVFYRCATQPAYTHSAHRIYRTAPYRRILFRSLSVLHPFPGARKRFILHCCIL